MVFVSLTSIAVNLKNIDQRITEVLPFEFNRDFSQFLNFKCSSQHENQCLILIRHEHHSQP